MFAPYEDYKRFKSWKKHNDKKAGLHRAIVGRFSHVVCQATTSNFSAYELSRNEVCDSPVDGNLYENDCRAKYRHRECYSVYQMEKWVNDEVEHNFPLVSKFKRWKKIDRKALKDKLIHLDILRTCQPIYNEASPILWATTTWSFRHVTDFTQFMFRLTPAQKRMMTSLYLDLDRSFKPSPLDWNVNWTQAMKSWWPTVEVYPNLTTLHVDILGIRESHSKWWTMPKKDYKYFGPGPDCSWLIWFRYSPLKEVRVICVQMENAGEPDSRESVVLNKTERAEMADGIRLALMNLAGGRDEEGQSVEDRNVDQDEIDWAGERDPRHRTVW